jgi:hypothetical protein
MKYRRFAMTHVAQRCLEDAMFTAVASPLDSALDGRCVEF